MELFKDIPGFEGDYQIGNLGHVKTLKPGIMFGSFLKPKIDRDGYCLINLCKNSIKTTYKIHRLVAFAFIENRDNLPQVNHKDTNKSNNAVTNLEWCTGVQNRDHFKKFGTRKSVKGRNFITINSRKVLQMNKDGKVIQMFDTVSIAGQTTGVAISSICCVLNGKKYFKSAGGFKWKYA